MYHMHEICRVEMGSIRQAVCVLGGLQGIIP